MRRMTTIIAEVYDAFRGVGVPDDQARAAAHALSNNEPRLIRIESDIGVLKTDVSTLKTDMAAVKNDVAQIHTIKWMMGTLIFLVVGVIGRLMFIH